MSGIPLNPIPQATNEHYLTRQDEMESNVRSYPRKLPLAIAKAQGCWVTDVEGNEYLDCLAGAGTLALAHNHPAILKSIQDTLASGLPLHTLDITTPLKDAFSEALLAHFPGGKDEYRLQFCGPTGADATEAAVKLAKTFTGRGNVISFSGGYHGMTQGSLALTGNLGAKNAVPNLMPGVDALTYYFENFIEDVESGVVKPAAVILEAIQGEGGVVVGPTKWLRKIREVTEKHGILMIADEVQAGFCRSGKMFAFQHAGIEPDIVVMSKAVGGSLPLAVLAIKKKFDAWQPAGHTGTFRGNQLAMATGYASLRIMSEQDLAGNAQARGDFIRSELNRLAQEFPCIGNVRGRGLMIGIEIVDERLPADRMGSLPADAVLAAEIQKACFNNKLLLERGGRNGTVVRLLAPLIITQQECEELIKRFRQSVADALESVRG